MYNNSILGCPISDFTSTLLKDGVTVCPMKDDLADLIQSHAIPSGTREQGAANQLFVSSPDGGSRELVVLFRCE